MKKLLIFLGVFLGAPGVIALMLHYNWFALTIAVLGLAGIWSVFSYVVANLVTGGKSDPIPGDHGLECSVCHEQDRWDRLLGVCYGKCREEKP